MDEQKKFDALMRLAEFRINRWKTRSDYKWKLSLALWALLAAAPLYMKYRPSETVLVLTLTVIVVLYAALWVEPLWRRDQNDVDTAFFYIEHAERLLGISKQEPRARPEAVRPVRIWPSIRGFLSPTNWSGWGQMLTTLLLAVIAYWTIGNSN
jgi:hypothetical protein